MNIEIFIALFMIMFAMAFFVVFFPHSSGWESWKNRGVKNV
jgi:hypothetical protein